MTILSLLVAVLAETVQALVGVVPTGRVLFRSTSDVREACPPLNRSSRIGIQHARAQADAFSATWGA
jgi:hypothetical protein